MNKGHVPKIHGKDMCERVERTGKLCAVELVVRDYTCHVHATRSTNT